MDLSSFTRSRRSVSDRLIALLVLLFGGFKSWTDDDSAEFVAQAVPLALAGQRTVANLTSTWVADQATTAAGVAVHAIAVPDEVLQRPGVTPEQVYHRPFVTARTQLARRRGPEVATSVASNRLAEIVEGDLQRAHSQAALTAIQALPEEAQPIGWRRVLQGDTNCPMCVVASTQLYSSGEANPLHQRCDCAVVLAYGDPAPADDTGRTQVEDALRALDVAPARMTELQRRALLRQMTQTHGELGDMLIRPGDHFTGPAELPS